MQITEWRRLDEAYLAARRIRMSKLQIHAGLALVMFADGATDVAGVVEISLCTRTPKAHSRASDQ